jgi:hypothetical protein
MVPSSAPDRYARCMSERAEAIDRAVAAYRALGELAETVEDEWQYVIDLSDAYEPGLTALADGPELPPGAIEAIDEAIEEIGLISDPHKAIDWLSTFPPRDRSGGRRGRRRTRRRGRGFRFRCGRGFRRR